MANVQITQLPSAGSITGTESVPIVQNGKTVQTTTGAIAAGSIGNYTFLTASSTPNLPNSRYFSTDANLTITDGGAQGAYRISLNGATAQLNSLATGFVVKTGASTLAARNIAVSGSGITIANGDGQSGNPTVSLSGLPLSLANAAGSGLLSLNASTSVSPVTLTGTSGQIAVANGTGVGGNPTISLSTTGVSSGTYTYPTITVDSLGRITSAENGSPPSPAGVTSFSGGTTGLNPSSPTTGAIVLSGALGVTNGGTGRDVGNYSVYANEIHVGKNGNDTTGDGTLINPVLTITKALTLIGGGINTVIVHPGSYSESPTVVNANTTIATSELTGANTQITGTLTLSVAARVSGIKLTNLTITGSGSIYISNCTVDTRVIKSGSNYVEIINSELQCVSGIQITGAGIVSIVGNKCWAVAVSNASASVLIKDCYQVITPSVTAGTLQIDGSAIFAASPASNAVTSSVGSFITLANSFILNSAGTNVERVSLAGSYSILNLVYDKTNSTFAGTNLNAIDYFSVINAQTVTATTGIFGGTF